MLRIIIAIIYRFYNDYITARDSQHSTTVEDEIAAVLAKDMADEIDNEIIKQLQGIANDK